MSEESTSVVRVEHPVTDYERWKEKGFDRDPLDRKASGVRRYRVLRAEDEPHLVAIELEFDNRREAERFAAGLAEMWRGVADRFGWSAPPRARVFELTATGEY